MVSKNISARIELDEYTNRVLGVVKARYGLRDKSEAIKKFVELHGDEFADKEVDDEYIKKIIGMSEEYFREHKNRKLSFKELDVLIE